MRMTKSKVVDAMIEGTSFNAKDKQRAISQIDKMMANKNMPVKRLATLVKLPDFMVRKFRKINERVTIV